MNQAEIVAIVRGLVPEVRKYIDSEISKMRDEVAKHCAQLKYMGAYAVGQTYCRGNFVTDDGALWHCNADTGTRPKDGGPMWTLAVKRGRDGKDAR